MALNAESFPRISFSIRLYFLFFVFSPLYPMENMGKYWENVTASNSEVNSPI